MRAAALLVVIVLSMASQALAWSQAGHKIIASVAYRTLTRPEQARVVEILREHPRFTEDFEDRMPSNVADEDQHVQNEWIFQQAAVWPDLARGLRGQASTDFHRSNWHYINVPHFLRPADRMALEDGLDVNLELNPPDESQRDMNVVQTIRLARRTLLDEDAADREKGLMMAWLFHNVGDVHQPMHSTALFSQFLFPRGDRGGNSVLTAQRGNLHTLWDRFPGGTAVYRTARNRSIAIVNDEDLAAFGEESAETLDEQDWLDESYELAVDEAYAPEIMGHLRALELDEDEGELPPIVLSTEYLQRGGRIANDRLVQAGYRLGAVLKQVVAEE